MPNYSLPNIHEVTPNTLTPKQGKSSVMSGKRSYRTESRRKTDDSNLDDDIDVRQYHYDSFDQAQPQTRRGHHGYQQEDYEEVDVFQSGMFEAAPSRDHSRHYNNNYSHQNYERLSDDVSIYTPESLHHHHPSPARGSDHQPRNNLRASQNLRVESNFNEGFAKKCDSFEYFPTNELARKYSSIEPHEYCETIEHDISHNKRRSVVSYDTPIRQRGGNYDNPTSLSPNKRRRKSELEFQSSFPKSFPSPEHLMFEDLQNDAQSPPHSKDRSHSLHNSRNNDAEPHATFSNKYGVHGHNTERFPVRKDISKEQYTPLEFPPNPSMVKSAPDRRYLDDGNSKESQSYYENFGHYPHDHHYPYGYYYHNRLPYNYNSHYYPYSTPYGPNHHPQIFRGYIYKVNDNDVLCGRGGATNSHIGNRSFRILVKKNQDNYLNAKKKDKPSVAAYVVSLIRKLDPPGRFLKKDTENGLWYDIGDERAKEKTSQALREGAPELRKRNSVNECDITSNSSKSTTDDSPLIKPDSKSESKTEDSTEKIIHQFSPKRDTVDDKIISCSKSVASQVSNKDIDEDKNSMQTQPNQKVNQQENDSKSKESDVESQNIRDDERDFSTGSDGTISSVSHVGDEDQIQPRRRRRRHKPRYSNDIVARPKLSMTRASLQTVEIEHLSHEERTIYTSFFDPPHPVLSSESQSKSEKSGFNLR